MNANASDDRIRDDRGGRHDYRSHNDRNGFGDVDVMAIDRIDGYTGFCVSDALIDARFNRIKARIRTTTDWNGKRAHKFVS